MSSASEDLTAETGLIQTATGARRDEVTQVMYCFFALFFLLLSYYLIKPLRNSQFLKDFDPRYLPLVYLGIPIVSLVVTKIYNYFCGRMDKFKLIVRVYLAIIACKIAFTWLLPWGGKPATVVFYFWGSVYFLLALATLWACFNDFFTCEQGERIYGFIATGAVSGNIVGAKLSSWMARSTYRPYATLVSASAMGIALLLLLQALRYRQARPEPERIPGEARPTPPAGSFWADVQELWRTPYVRGIAIMVCFLATYTTTVDFLSQKIIDQRLAEQEYRRVFTDYNAGLNAQEGGPSEQLNQHGFQLIYGLKSMPADKAAALLDENHLTELYKTYQADLESQTRATFSDIFLYQGVVGVILLTLISRFIFKRVGLQLAVLLMPTFALFTLVAFSFPLELLAMEFMLVLSGALNYSLNNASKEILYTNTDEATKFKVKPLIEGPGMRTGDISASILSIATMALAAQQGWKNGDPVFLSITFALVLVWWLAIRRTGKIYDAERSADARHEERVAR